VPRIIETHSETYRIGTSPSCFVHNSLSTQNGKFQQLRVMPSVSSGVSSYLPCTTRHRLILAYSRPIQRPFAPYLMHMGRWELLSYSLILADTFIVISSVAIGRWVYIIPAGIPSLPAGDAASMLRGSLPLFFRLWDRHRVYGRALGVNFRIRRHIRTFITAHSMRLA
jgi:hypothetical protein